MELISTNHNKKQRNMENLKLTEKEMVLLKTITESDYYENGRESVVWDFSVYDYLPFGGKTRSGVVSSLVQKGLISVTEKAKKFIKVNGKRQINPYWDPNDYGTICITSDGYSYLDELELINEYGSFKD